MTISEERKELEDTIEENLWQIQKNLDQATRRISMARQRMKREAEGSARIVPEDKTLKQDLHEIASTIHDVKTDMDARMEDYNNLLELIGEARKEDKE